ncbi:UDP-N-acetylglucosamine 2-epimerase (non-hydrolyzing) [Dysgonomonas sp. HDW5A]|uniref:non-hydrolyzing UDP-N-acetylglucosamine 2-epimerase n=1 Tax=Dysgonomonas sp. HDW5A TaxID=2714926 RepID=UPI00140D20EE|nr:UDP-N-acetylglucosamine 2-epimerase (non-hydrolyzing) [Dysgonomonas sp. HDW5A]QIK59602.1 UDP-N-acetylglucosamine 2-epimerase (non-hydrolyzing) [Dysgonomonas sp. HDW5A]
MKKVLIVFGTRPEAIKMVPLVKEFQKYCDQIETIVCVTGQHRQMLDQVLEVFDIKPDYDLNIMAPNQDLYDITSKVLLGMRDVIKKCSPDMILVHGDTTTSMAAAIAGFYQQVKIGHVEAGLRTYNLYSPWPEEMNRQLTDRLCDFCFAPTETSKKNLLQEKIEDTKIFVTGNTVIDALLMAVDIIRNNSTLQNKIVNEINTKGYTIIEGKRYILVTGHRRENFGDGFLNICKSLKEIAISNPDIDIVYPVHLNPNVQGPVFELLSGIDNITLISPLDYLPFIYMMQHSYLILTDSGGVQEEAPSLGKPVLVMRNTTERPEAVEAGTVRLVGTDAQSIVKNVNSLLKDESLYLEMSHAHNPYGDGRASQRIVEILL